MPPIVGLDYFGARYYSGAQGRFTSPDAPLLYLDREHPQSLNLYSYVQNNPLNRIDPDGHLTVIVPGTGWKPSDWNGNMKLVQEAKEKFHDSDVRILPWTGHLGSGAVSEGGQMLRDMVAYHSFAPGEQLNVIGHSRGGEVALDASAGLTRPIDNLITLATPDYAQSYNLENIGTWVNISVAQDWVQLAASSERGQPRSYYGAQNLTVDARSYGHITSHSAVWQNNSLRSLWWQYWQNHAGCHEWWDDKSNTLHGCL